MSRLGPRFGLAVACLVLAAGPGYTSGEARVEVQVVVPPLQRLTTGFELVPLPDATAADLIVGFVEPPRPIGLTIFSNCPWELRVRRAGTEAQDEVGARAPSLLWCLGRGRFAALGSEWVRVAGEERAAGVRAELRLRIPLSWGSGRPGLYQPRVEYDLVPAGL